MVRQQHRSVGKGIWSALGANRTWDDEGVEVFHVQLGQVGHITPGNACALLQHVALPVGGLPLTVVHHVHLVHVGREHLHLVRVRREDHLPK